MIWTVIWSDKSAKQLKKLDKTVARKIIARVEEIVDDPFKAVKRLTNSTQFSLRVGDYRVILELRSGKLVVFVVSTAKRGRSYDRL